MAGSKILFATLAMTAASFASADNPILGEIEIRPASDVERDSGVWLDDQYVGFVKDIQGSDSLVVVPGEHTLLFQLVGYEDVQRTVTIEPGDRKSFRLSMQQRSEVHYPAKHETARIRMEIEPSEAAVFVDGEFVGPVERFDGRGGMRIAPGSYRFTIALPGYQAFTTEMTVIEGQTYEIRTKLPKGPIDGQAPELTAGPVLAD